MGNQSTDEPADAATNTAMDCLLPPDIVALARRVIVENAAIGRRIALAESCTGGLVAAALTEIPGCSAVLEGAFITYSNAAKHGFLGVSEDMIDTFGPVSVACVWAMAQGALKRSDADVAVAISGIAGPGGGTLRKPVGLMAFAKAVRGNDEVEAEERIFDATTGALTRSDVRRQATVAALELLLP